MTEREKELLQIAKLYTSKTDLYPNEYTKGTSPFIDYILEDKSKYPFMCDVHNSKLNHNYIDVDKDFKLGDSKGILMNIDFMVVGTDKYSKVADYYKRTGHYCPYPKDSNQAKIFWQNETARRKQGVTANCKLYFKDVEKYYDPNTTDVERKNLLHPLRITGDHYNYLNYSRIERVPNEQERKELDSQGSYKIQTIEGFPRYWDGDYWNFKIDEFIANNSFNLCKAKARRKGFSYKRGSQAANTLNLNKNVTVILAASIMKYLTDKGATTYMAKVNLDWLENHTYWRRGYLSEKLEDIELGYKKTKEGNKAFGFRSKLLSAAIGVNESSVIGKKALEIDIEEAGKCPNLQAVLDVTRSNMESGSIQIGTLRVYGTAGTEASNWTAFSNAFYNPDINSMLPLENVWDKDKRYSVCGFFFPQIWCYEPYIHDGNSLLFSAWQYDKSSKDNARNNTDSKTYTTFVAQRANTPSEAFINTTNNIFGSPELNNHIADIMTDKSKQFYRDGWYIADETGKGVTLLSEFECVEQKLFNGRFHNYISDVPHTNKTDIHGCVREYYPPHSIEGEVPPDNYFCVLDAYRVDKMMNDVTDKHSLYSWQIYSRAIPNNPYGGKRLCAEYTGRLNTMEDNDRELLKALIRYNCKVLIEAGTGETIVNFKKWGYRHKLLKDPLNKINRQLDSSKTESYGIVIGDSDVKLDGIRMLKDFLYEVIGTNEDDTPIYRLHNIYSPSFLLELQRFNAKDNFDRISTAILAMYEFLKDSTIKRNVIQSNGVLTLGQRLLNKK